MQSGSYGRCQKYPDYMKCQAQYAYDKTIIE